MDNTTAKLLDKAYADSDRDTTAEIMAELLMDDSVSTYGAFEDIYLRYASGTDEFRKGVDAALTILTGLDFAGIARRVTERSVACKGETETRRVTDIVWCADPDGGFGEDELPTEVDIPADVEDDKIADYLSDTYGYLVDAFVTAAE